MNKQYVLVDVIDLTLDDIIIPENENQEEIPEILSPTEAMQAHFMRNCADLGIFVTI